MRFVYRCADHWPVNTKSPLLVRLSRNDSDGLEKRKITGKLTRQQYPPSEQVQNMILATLGGSLVAPKMDPS